MRITKHAYERAKDRFGLSESEMRSIIDKEFDSATLYRDGDDYSFKYYIEGRNMVVVQSKDRSAIVTVYPMVDNSKIDICNVVEWELREFLEERRYRFKKDFASELAEVTSDMAELSHDLSRTMRQVYVDDKFYKLEKMVDDLKGLLDHKDEVMESYNAIERKLKGGK